MSIKTKTVGNFTIDDTVITSIEDAFVPLSGNITMGAIEISSNLTIQQKNSYTNLPGSIAYGLGAAAIGSEFNSQNQRIIKYVSTNDINSNISYSSLYEYVLSNYGLVSSEVIDVLDVNENDIVSWNEYGGFIWRKYDDSTTGYEIEDISVENLNQMLSIPDQNKLYKILDAGQLSSYLYGLSGMTMTKNTDGNWVLLRTRAIAFGDGSFAQGTGIAYGQNSFATGGSRAQSYQTFAHGGTTNFAFGRYSHAEGNSKAYGSGSHSEGTSKAYGMSSHSEGHTTSALGQASHAEGYKVYVNGYCAHAEGAETSANGSHSHTEGFKTYTQLTASHAEGMKTYALNNYTHAEGCDTSAYMSSSHVEGISSITVEGKMGAHAEGEQTSAVGRVSHAEGIRTYAYGYGSHAEGIDSYAYGTGSHSEGNKTSAYGDCAHVNGLNVIVSGDYSSAIGNAISNIGDYSYVVGRCISSNSNYSFAWSGKNSYYNIPMERTGTFNIDPINGISGFYIGDQPFSNIIKSYSQSLVGQSFELSNLELSSLIKVLVNALGGKITLSGVEI